VLSHARLLPSSWIFVSPSFLWVGRDSVVAGLSGDRIPCKSYPFLFPGGKAAGAWCDHPFACSGDSFGSDSLVIISLFYCIVRVYTKKCE
jgi:hypothetical protein